MKPQLTKIPKPVLVKIPDSLAVAISLYYINRANQYKINHISVLNEDGTLELARIVSKGIVWDKQKDLDNIDKTAIKFKLSHQSSGGIFWFTNSKGETVTVDETTFPLAEK